MSQSNLSHEVMASQAVTLAAMRLGRSILGQTFSFLIPSNAVFKGVLFKLSTHKAEGDSMLKELNHVDASIESNGRS